MGRIIGSGVSGSVTSGVDALLTGKDPAEALLRGGLTAAMSAGVSLTVDATLKEIPGFSPPANRAEEAFQRAVKASLGAAISSGGDIKKIEGAVIKSFLGSAGGYIKDSFKDSGGDLSAANSQFRASERDYTNNIEQQNKLVK
jgi:hypothetical protein